MDRAVHLGVFFRGGCRQGGGGGIVYDNTVCEWDAPKGHSGQCCVHLYKLSSYRRLSPQFQFSLSGVTLVYLSQWMSTVGQFIVLIFYM
jgi:hypothetical protein